MELNEIIYCKLISTAISLIENDDRKMIDGEKFYRNLVEMFSQVIDGIPVFSVIMDKTTDNSIKEQVSVCIRLCDSKFQAQEIFVGFYNSSRTDAKTLFGVLKHVLDSLGVMMQSIRGQAYNGAANMFGR